MDEFELIDRPIAFQRSFVRLTGSVNAALMLSQAVYWARRTKDKDGWFWKTQEEWEEETGLSRWEQESARKQLKGKGFWIEEKRGLPGRMFYRLDRETLRDSMLKNHILVCGKTSNLSEVKPHTLLLTETTSETTSKTLLPFDIFWNGYPRKAGKQKAEKLWLRLKEEERKACMRGLGLWRQTVQWVNEDGKFIPYGSTFLHRRQWEDEPWVGAFEEGLSTSDTR